MLAISILAVLAVCAVVLPIAIVVNTIVEAVKCRTVAEYWLEKDGSLTPINRRSKK